VNDNDCHRASLSALSRPTRLLINIAEDALRQVGNVACEARAGKSRENWSDRFPVTTFLFLLWFLRVSPTAVSGILIIGFKGWAFSRLLYSSEVVLAVVYVLRRLRHVE
jgi:hypothetical protein